MNKRLLMSFSGGETSAFLCWWLKRNYKRLGYEEMIVVFANTGEENEETLIFVDRCDRFMDFGTVWVESVIYPGQKKRPGARVVTFETASRSGEPFEAAIAKYGIPNSKFKDCTRNLKMNPIISYAESIGWEKGTYDTAIGIRIDELDRISAEAKKRNLIYPLTRSDMCEATKPNINDFWRRQNFRLYLKGYQGNCRTCWKKSKRKLLTIAIESPEKFAFMLRMEATYQFVGPEFAKAARGEWDMPEGYHRTFFRGGKSALEILAEAATLGSDFERADDDARLYEAFDSELDAGGGCEESCEVFSDEDMAADDEEAE